MSCLTPIMAIGNKIVLLCEGKSSKLFPFDYELPSLLPVANKSCLQFLLETLCKTHRSQILIVAPNNAQISKLASEFQVEYIVKEEHIFPQLSNLSKTLDRMMIIKAETLLHEEDIVQLLEKWEDGKNYLLVEALNRDTRSIDIFGCLVKEQIEVIYAHPREHYINAMLDGVCILQKECFSSFQYASPGFHQVNCGQMCDDHHDYIEEAIQCSIEAGDSWYPIYPKKVIVHLEFPWDLAKANEVAAEWLTSFANTKNESFIMDDTCVALGIVQCGEQVVIQDGVRFEGNCLIGHHVRIEKGATIGKNCVIGDYSVISYGCKLADNTVIGPNNKIGYHAEISGVTFDGVCAVHACEVFGIIGRKVDIAAGVVMAILRFDDMQTTQNIHGKAYQTSYTNRVFIGDYCRTGVHNVFLPGAKIGRQCAIGPGIVVDHDVEANSLLLLKQELIQKQWGPHRYGW